MLSERPARPCAAGFLGALLLAFAAGCSNEQGAPTKIYEGGGTIPEIVDQPEPGSPKAAKTKAAKTKAAKTEPAKAEPATSAPKD